MFGGCPLMRRSSSLVVECMIVIKALALIQSSLGRDLDLLVVQMSLATLPLKLTIILPNSYTVWDSVMTVAIFGKTVVYGSAAE